MVSPRANQHKFSRHEIEVAIKVVMQCKLVSNWVKGQAKFLNVDLNTADGQEFYRREARAAAIRLIG